VAVPDEPLARCKRARDAGAPPRSVPSGVLAVLIHPAEPLGLAAVTSAMITPASLHDIGIRDGGGSCVEGGGAVVAGVPVAVS
jgi:hypothetical protein